MENLFLRLSSMTEEQLKAFLEECLEEQAEDAVLEAAKDQLANFLGLEEAEKFAESLS